ncbi:MAG: hypothetical protein RO469_15710 [Thermincola sp.]|jgi:hypothetical protein|nr:hypothetical protein [Thermincola sp.]MDT3702677.1 hypothetical protein [Thermincola sp.]
MIRKSDIVRDLVKEREYKKALRIAKDFRLGITPAQSNSMKKAYECMVHSRFYLSIGEDVPKRIEDGVETLIDLYGRQKERPLLQTMTAPGAAEATHLFDKVSLAYRLTPVNSEGNE